MQIPMKRASDIVERLRAEVEALETRGEIDSLAYIGARTARDAIAELVRLRQIEARYKVQRYRRERGTH
jgi:hypothetical protein